ncbi:MAG: hypothetical protein WCK98_05750 [bacterium]
MPHTKFVATPAELESKKLCFENCLKQNRQFLKDFLGGEILASLELGEFHTWELSKLNQELYGLVFKGVSLNQDFELNTNQIILRPDLASLTEQILDQSLKSKLEIEKVESRVLDKQELANLFLRRNIPRSIWPTLAIGFYQKQAKIITFKNLQPEDIIKLNSNLKHLIYKEINLASKVLGSRFYTLFDPLRFLEKSFLGLLENSRVESLRILGLTYLKTIAQVLS